ncbi:hypothetical protein RKD23_001018 [Streptomyces sp. SAI-170]
MAASGSPFRLCLPCPLLDCPADADESYGYTGEDGSPDAHRFQKADGEADSEAFGDATVFLRPGVILADGRPVDHPRWAEHGIVQEEEAKILASFD